MLTGLHPIFAKLLAPFAPKPQIITQLVYPPVPSRKFDWCAYRDGDEERGQYGWGSTEQEAITDLLTLEDEG